MKNPIGVLGGMGPEASNYLYKVLIELSIQNFCAKNNDEFPDIVLYSIPVPDFISDESNKKKALDILQKKILSTRFQKFSCMAIACNTAHLLLKDLQSNTTTPFISMIEEVVNIVARENINTVGILGTPQTLKHRLYQNSLDGKKVNYLIPDKNQIKMLEGVIRNVIKGNSSKNDVQLLKKIADSMKKRGAQGIILGCTELPLVFPKKYALPVYNSVTILAEALLRKYYKQNTIGEKL